MFPEIYIRKLRYEEAKRLLIREIESFFYQGVEDVSIVHGVGDYILRNMVLQELAKIDYVQILEQAHFNPGSLKVRLLIPPKEVLKRIRY